MRARKGVLSLEISSAFSQGARSYRKKKKSLRMVRFR